MRNDWDDWVRFFKSGRPGCESGSACILTERQMARLANPASSWRESSLFAFVAAVAVLYFAKRILVPLSLAALLAFLLTPVVRRLEAWRLGRIPAVVLVLLVSLSLLAAVGWIVTEQLINVADQLPNYRANIQTRMESLRGRPGGILAKVTDDIGEVSNDLANPPPKQVPQSLPVPPNRTRQPLSAATGEGPLQVEVIERQPTAVQSLENFLGPLLGPLGTALIVVVFAIGMLIKREDLRTRLLRLIAHEQLNLVTQAFDELTERVSRYLRMQFAVNAAFGALIAIGLYFIGLPNALLLGALAGVLRFVPYVGPVIGGSVPVILSLALFESWLQTILCVCLFLAIELTVAYVIEPWIYGAHTGISALAILVAAVFWTVLWGPVGLVLSTPLTVCLFVLGSHVPQFEFLEVLLGDEPVLAPAAHFYQRLLAMDQQEARVLVSSFLKERSLLDLYDVVMIPALSMAEEDRHKGALDAARETFIIRSISEFVAELADYEAPPASIDENGGSAKESRSLLSYCRVICLSTRDSADEISAGMLAQILGQAGYPVVSFQASDSSAAILHEFYEQEGDVVCISAVPPFALLKARSLSEKVRGRLRARRIIVGLWNFSGGGLKAEERLAKAFKVEVVTTLAQAVESLAAIQKSIEYKA